MDALLKSSKRKKVDPNTSMESTDTGEHSWFLSTRWTWTIQTFVSLVFAIFGWIPTHSIIRYADNASRKTSHSKSSGTGITPSPAMADGNSASSLLESSKASLLDPTKRRSNSTGDNSILKVINKQVLFRFTC